MVAHRFNPSAGRRSSYPSEWHGHFTWSGRRFPRETAPYATGGSATEHGFWTWPPYPPPALGSQALGPCFSGLEMAHSLGGPGARSRSPAPRPAAKNQLGAEHASSAPSATQDPALLPAPLPGCVSLESGPRLPPKPPEAFRPDRWETGDAGVRHVARPLSPWQAAPPVTPRPDGSLRWARLRQRGERPSGGLRRARRGL